MPYKSKHLGNLPQDVWAAVGKMITGKLSQKTAEKARRRYTWDEMQRAKRVLDTFIPNPKFRKRNYQKSSKPLPFAKRSFLKNPVVFKTQKKTRPVQIVKTRNPRFMSLVTTKGR